VKTLETYEERRMFVEELKKQWKILWRDRIEDKMRAEGISDKDYSQLFIERGTVIMATRKFKSPEFGEIMRRYFSSESKTFSHSVCPDPVEGGWGKFIRDATVARSPRSARMQLPRSALSNQNGKGDLKMKHRGKGWLHFRK